MERLENTIATLLGLAFMLAIGMMCGQSIHKQQMVVEAIRAGADPLVARCALDGPGGSGWSDGCVLSAGKLVAPRQEGAAK